jgi:esterase/lipase superfamily enzyme
MKQCWNQDLLSRVALGAILICLVGCPLGCGAKKDAATGPEGLAQAQSKQSDTGNEPTDSSASAPLPPPMHVPTESGETPRVAGLPRERADGWIPPSEQPSFVTNEAPPQESTPVPPFPTAPAPDSPATSETAPDLTQSPDGSESRGVDASDSPEPGSATEPGERPSRFPPLTTLPLPGAFPHSPSPPAVQDDNAAQGNPLRTGKIRIAPAPRMNPLRLSARDYAPARPNIDTLKQSLNGSPPPPPRIPAGAVEPRIPHTPPADLPPVRDGGDRFVPQFPANREPSGGSVRPLTPPTAADYGPPPSRSFDNAEPSEPTSAQPGAPAPESAEPMPAEPAPAESEMVGPTQPEPAESTPAESEPAESAPPSELPQEVDESGTKMPEVEQPASAAPDFADPAAESTDDQSQANSTEPPRRTMNLMGPGDSRSAEEKAPAESAGSQTVLPLANTSDTQTPAADTPYKTVTVYYGTDRLAVAAGTGSESRRFSVWTATVLVATCIAASVALAVAYRVTQRPWIAVAGGIATTVIGLYFGQPFANRGAQIAAAPGAPFAYGNARGELEYGECIVTIPKIHKEGKIERPSIWRLEVQERSDRHIIVKSVERRDDKAFFDAVRRRVAESPREDLFVFIHGYNVSFETAARRTAQMASDLEFQGAPIFYSWPSQGGLLQYTVDENNVAWTVPHLKQFLHEVVAQSNAKAINIIAHSMGNRALAAAIRELTLETRPTGKQFNQIVLAAPDIDAEVFKRDIAPMLTQQANQVTVYASSRDQALVASKLVHGYPRAGDSGSNLVVFPGVETIDVTEVDTGILGHSYYGNSQPILQDLEQLFCTSSGAARRPWLEPAERDGQRYWIFEESTTASRIPEPLH